jgi:hypothetical protein
MKLILPIVAAVLLLAPLLLVIGCSHCVADAAPGRRNDHRGEHWTQRPPTGPATERTADKDGNPNFGPR